MRCLSCAGLILALAASSGLARGDTPNPYPGHLAPSPDGRWYAIVRGGDPCRFLLVRRRDGASARPAWPPPDWNPVSPDAWRPPEVDDRDRVVARGTCHTPQEVACLEEGRGLLLLDSWWGGGRDVVLARYGPDGKPMWSKRLADLFGADTRASFSASVMHTAWRSGWWLDRTRGRVVVVGANGEPLVYGLDDGKPGPFDFDDALGRLERGTEAQQVLALDVVLRRHPAWAPNLRSRTRGRTLRPAVEVRLLLCAAAAGDEEARRIVLDRSRVEPDPALRMDVLRRLPEALGPAQALPVLLEELRTGKSWEGVRDGLVAMGRPAAPALARLVADRTSGDLRVAAAAVLRDMGRTAEPAIPALRDAAAEGRDPMSETAASALAEIDTGEAAAALVVVLEKGSPAARREAASFFQGRPNRSAIPGLIAALEAEQDEFWRDVIADALADASGQRLGPDGKPVRRWWEAQPDPGK